MEVLPLLAESSEQTQVPKREASDPGEAFHQLPRPEEDLLRDPGRALGHLGHGDDRGRANKDLYPDGILPRARRQVQEDNFLSSHFFDCDKKRNMFCHRIQKLDTKLLEFRNLIRETVYDACRSSTKSKEKNPSKTLKHISFL